MIEQGFVRTHFRDGTFSDIPVEGLPETIRLMSPRGKDQYPRDLIRVEYPEKPGDTATKPPELTKDSLIEHLMKDNKVVATELIEWINGSDKIEDIKLVLEGEKRKTVIAAAKERMTELINSI